MFFPFTLFSLPYTMGCMGKKLGRMIRWIVRSTVLGICVGVAMWALTTCVMKATTLRESHPWLLFTLPLGALCIAWLYQTLGPYLRSGTAQVIEMINQGLLAISSPVALKDNDQDTKNISVKMAPLLFASTILSHIVGASTGKEGAGVQIGSSIGNYLSHLEDLLLPKKLEEHSPSNNGIWLISGAGAAFGALFGAPVAGTLFGLQFSSPKVNRTDAFIPCLTASFVAFMFGKNVLYAHTLAPPLAEAVPLTIGNVLLLSLLGIIMGLCSLLFIYLARKWKGFLAVRIANIYRRVLVSTILLLALSLLFFLIVGDFSLNGLSAGYIGTFAPWYVPLGKMVLTILSIGCGFVGGEVIPIMVMGSTTAALFAPLFGMPISALAMYGAIGMLSAGTKLPLACFMLGLELFGYGNVPTLFLVCLVSYSASGFGGIYEKQERTIELEGR